MYKARPKAEIKIASTFKQQKEISDRGDNGQDRRPGDPGRMTRKLKKKSSR